MIAGSEVTAMIDNLRSLTQEQRQGARKKARDAVIRAIGPKPAREHFNQSTISKYPPSVTRLIFLLCLVLLLAAFTPSAIRLYVIGSQTFGQAVSSSAAQTAVGLATVLSAEVGQVVFSLALATLGTSRSAKRLLMVSMMIATTIALVGNVQIALPGHENSPFAWLESIAPPLLVLSTAYVMKEQFWNPSKSATPMNAHFRLPWRIGKRLLRHRRSFQLGCNSMPMHSRMGCGRRTRAGRILLAR
jgi:hypothetical protein